MQSTKKILGSQSNRKKNVFFFILQVYITAKAARKSILKLTEQMELNSFTNITAKIDIDALKT